MKTKLAVWRQDKVGFHVAKIAHARRNVLVGNLLRQRQVILIMARFGSQEREIKCLQIIIQPGRQSGKTFAGAGFDIRPANQLIN